MPRISRNCFDQTGAAPTTPVATARGSVTGRRYRGAMTSLALPVGASFTVDDVEAFPDGGFRYELYDGLLVVTPAPDHAHQTAVLELAVILRAALAGSPLKVLVAPFEWRIGRRTEFQ